MFRSFPNRFVLGLILSSGLPSLAHAACTVTLMSPANNAELTTAPIFQWRSTGDCSRFTLQVAANRTFTSGLTSVNNGTRKTYAMSEATWETNISGSWGSGGYWRVQAIDSTGVRTNTSPRTFTVDPDLDGDGVTVNDGDCNDSDAGVYPGNIEVNNDGIDQDCDGIDHDEGDSLDVGDDADVIDQILAAEAETWPETGGGSGYELPYAYGVHMGISTGPNCGGHAGTSYAEAIDFNVTGSTYESTNNIYATAIAAGDVVATVTNQTNSNNTGYGNTVLIRHDNGEYSYYAHLTSGGVLVEAGDRVCAGQELGLIGQTGNSSGDHLHIELRDGSGDTIELMFEDFNPKDTDNNPATSQSCSSYASTSSHESGGYESENALGTCAELDAPVADVYYDSVYGWNYVYWNAVSGAYGYRVFWGTGSGVDTTSEDLGETTTTDYGHSGVVDGGTYCYRVSAVDVDGSLGLMSDEVCLPEALNLSVGCGGDYSTVQDAVDAASDGDIIPICAGTYSGNVTVDGKILTFQGEGESDTILTASSGAIVRVSGSGSLVMEDLTIAGTGSYVSGLYGLRVGPGSADLVSVTVRDINSNTAAIMATTGDIMMSGVTIQDNTGTDSYPALTTLGGTITGNDVVMDSNYGANYGSAIYCSGGVVDFDGFSITNNDAPNINYGGAVALSWGCTASFDNGSFADNTGYEVGALYAEYDSVVTVSNTTMERNLHNTASSYRAGAFLVRSPSSGQSLVLSNVTFGSGADSNGPIRVGVFNTTSGSDSLYYYTGNTSVTCSYALNGCY